MKPLKLAGLILGGIFVLGLIGSAATPNKIVVEHRTPADHFTPNRPGGGPTPEAARRNPVTVRGSVDNCITRANLLQDRFLDLAAQSEQVDTTNPDQVDAFVRQGRTTVVDGRTFVNDCGHLGDTSAITASIDATEDGLDLIETINK